MPKAKIETVEFEDLNKRMLAAGFDVRDIMGKEKFNGYRRWLKKKGYVESHTTPKMQEQFAEYMSDPEGVALEPAYLDFWHDLIAWKKNTTKRVYLVDESIIPPPRTISAEERDMAFENLGRATGNTAEFMKENFPSAINDMIKRIEARHEGYTKLVAAILKEYGGPVKIRVRINF